MTCSEAKLKLEPCVSGTLTPEDRIALEEHLAICEGCRLELELTRAVMGSPTFDGAEESPSTKPASEFVGAEPTPAPDPKSFEPPSTSDADEEISFADLALDEPATNAAPEPGMTLAGTSGAGSSGSSASAKGEKDADTSNLWDFEPVDAHRDAGPPEGSLSFANEALTRKREDALKRKATIMRLALWGGGVCGGLLLLGVSVWIALAFRQGDAPKNPPGTQITPAPTPAPTPVITTPTVADSAAVAPGVPPATAPTVDPSVPAPQPPATTPPPDITVHAPVGQGVSDVQPQPASPKPKPKTPPKPAAKPTPKPAVHNTDDSSEAAPAWSPSDLQPPPAPSPRAVDRGPVSPPAAQPVPPSATQPSSTPPDGSPSGTPNPTQPTGTPSAPPPAATTPAPAASQPAPSGGGETPAPPAAGVTKPVDRLHIATENAAQNQDLVALRKLKESWKTMVHSVTGPDRSRTKRELADCLWSIQELSGRLNDRKEALAAYRDYVLTAPAGGTDSRSISRMRYLEESLAEAK